MLYKTMVLELLQERPHLYDPLIRKRQLLQTLERLARELKISHEAWKETLTQARPDSDPSQIASEALEMALKDLVEALPTESPPGDSEPFWLDQAMVFLRRHTPNA
jgi:hypothetical protein